MCFEARPRPVRRGAVGLRTASLVSVRRRLGWSGYHFRSTMPIVSFVLPTIKILSSRFLSLSLFLPLSLSFGLGQLGSILGGVGSPSLCHLGVGFEILVSALAVVLYPREEGFRNHSRAEQTLTPALRTDTEHLSGEDTQNRLGHRPCVRRGGCRGIILFALFVYLRCLLACNADIHS